MKTRIAPDDAVITPSGRTAVVRAVTIDGFALLRYLDEPATWWSQVTLDVRLLRIFTPGGPKPEPVRVNAPARAAAVP